MFFAFSKQGLGWCLKIKCFFFSSAFAFFAIPLVCDARIKRRFHLCNELSNDDVQSYIDIAIIFLFCFSKIFLSFLSRQDFVMVSLLTKNLPVDGWKTINFQFFFLFNSKKILILTWISCWPIRWGPCRIGASTSWSLLARWTPCWRVCARRTCRSIAIAAVSLRSRNA